MEWNDNKPLLVFFFFFLQDVILQKGAGPLGLSIVGGSDHSCVPFGADDPGVFISKVFFPYIS